MKMGTGFNWLG